MYLRPLKQTKLFYYYLMYESRWFVIGFVSACVCVGVGMQLKVTDLTGHLYQCL